VSLSSAASTVVSVNYATANGTATAGTDYTAIPPTTLTFNPGETSKTITVAVNGDNQVELNETFFINLSNLQTNGSNVILADNQGQGTITDDDRPKITIAPGTNPVEGGTVGTFIITLDTPAPTGGIVVNFNTTGSTATLATDYSLTAGTNGDFNGDGKLDLAVANHGGNNVSVLLGTGTGSFGTATNFSVGSSPISVTVGDFNGDGKSDLATANHSSSNVSVLLGTGTGSFGPATNFTVGISPRSVTVGDFNGDGKSDLATANRSSSNVSVLLGTGTGSFGTATNFTVGSSPHSVMVGDFNGDGKSDLATANRYGYNVSVLLGTGTGSFGTATNFSVGSSPFSVTVGDFNGDGKSDLATANYLGNSVSVLLGTGTGSFGPATNFSVGSRPTSVTVGDFNGDGKSDLATANLNGGNNVSVLLGTGTGSFGTATNFAVGSSPTSVTVGDFNGDGKSDLATANANSSYVSVLLNADPTATVTITDPSISLTINDVTVTEGNSGTTNAVFTVSLSSAASTVVSVDYATANGTATAGTDYTAIPPTTLTFNPGETSKTITVPVNGDNQVELNETFFLNLSNLQANGSNVTLADNQGQGTITNDDERPKITIASGTNPVEGGTIGTFIITLDTPAPTGGIVVNFRGLQRRRQIGFGCGEPWRQQRLGAIRNRHGQFWHRY